MMEKGLFLRSTTLRVRNYEVDWQGIVHNTNYLRYCEVGRIEYLREIGVGVDMLSINSSSRVVVVRNEIDHLAAARYDEWLRIWTRVASIGDTSFVMEGFIERMEGGERLAENVAYHAWLHPVEQRSIRVPDPFRELVKAAEGDRCRFREEGSA